MLKRIGMFIVVVLCALPFVAAQNQTQTQPQSVNDLDMVRVS